MDAVQRGMDLSSATAKKKPNDPTWHMWQFHFHLEKAELHLGSGNFRAAETELSAGLALAESMDSPRVQLIFALAQLQRAIAQRTFRKGERSGVGEAGDIADKAMKAVQAREGRQSALTCGSITA